MHRQATDLTLVKMDGAGIFTNQPANHVEAGRLAGAVGAEQADAVATLDLEINAFHGLDFAESFRQPARGDDQGIVHLTRIVRLGNCGLLITVHNRWAEQ